MTPLIGLEIRAVIGLVPCQDFKQEGRRGGGGTDVRSGASLGSLENRRPLIQVHAWPSQGHGVLKMPETAD